MDAALEDDTSHPEPRVSVVVPLYQKGDVVERAVRSVLAQTEERFELIVVDDGSTDDGPDRVEAFADPRIRLLRPEHQGVSATRNLGMAAARAPLIALLDADDEWREGHLEGLRHLAERFPAAGLLATGWTTEGRAAVLPVYRTVPREGGILEDFFAAMVVTEVLWPSNVAVPRRVFEELGGFPEGEDLAEDWAFWARVALRHPVALLPEALAHRHHDARVQESRRLFFTGSETALGRCLRSALDAGDLPPERRRSVAHFLAKHRLKMARHCIKSGQGGRARDLVREARALGAPARPCRRIWMRSWVSPARRYLRGRVWSASRSSGSSATR